MKNNGRRSSGDFEMVMGGDEEGQGSSVANPMSASPPRDGAERMVDDEEGTMYYCPVRVDLPCLLALSVALNVLLTLGFAISRSTVESMGGGGGGADRSISELAKSGSSGCSRHGIYDFLSEECRCHACWKGSKCNVQTPPESCLIPAEGGDPLIFEDYCKKNRAYHHHTETNKSTPF